VLAAACLLAAGTGRPARAETAPVPRAAVSVHPNDNRRPAGHYRSGVLTVHLVARTGVWEPDGPNGGQHTVEAFAEEGKALETPGPLLRAPAGSRVQASVTNSLAVPLWVYGLGDVRGLADSFLVAPGATVARNFRLDAPGTFYYAARGEARAALGRTHDDSQLHGAIVVDPAGAPATPDRIFVISTWYTIDTTTVSGLGPNSVLAINGLSWPYTERIETTQGDTLHWRVVNVTPFEHPMHLHGFYFRVDARGDGARDTLYTAQQQRLGVTEVVMPGQTMAITWAPVRPGNWVFHCHFASHITAPALFDADRRMPTGPMPIHTAMHNHMGGLVIGIHVRAKGPEPRAAATARPIRIIVRSRAAVYGRYAGYAYVIGGSPEEQIQDSLPTPGPTLVLTRGEPVAITIVNQSHEDAAIHWHGIELQSFPDGVPGWSGMGRNTLPMVAAHDSLTVRFTPPRAGTFIFHSHSNEFQQIGSGLYGALVVVEPGAPRDPETDRVMLLSDDGPTVSFLTPPPAALLNGRPLAEPVVLRAGVSHRLRLINIRTDYLMTVGLADSSGTLSWTVLAKDGADLPSPSVRPATLQLAPGETYDVEVAARPAGDLKLHLTMPTFDNVPPADVAVQVR
jgi:FtsP/CotA-like multicopper oxidase with cupredoxin domain